MGILGDINIDVGSVLSGIGSLAKDIRSAITGEISPEKQAEIELMASKLEAAASEAQTKINEIEAAHPSVFVSGWRPAVGWICAAALGYHYIGRHLIAWVSSVLCTVFQWPMIAAPPAPDLGDLIVILLGMLGLGGYRTYEKFKGVARQ